MIVAIDYIHMAMIINPVKTYNTTNRSTLCSAFFYLIKYSAYSTFLKPLYLTATQSVVVVNAAFVGSDPDFLCVTFLKHCGELKNFN
jgi:hypothetical protein